MTKLTKEEQIKAIYDLKVGYTLGHADIAILKSMARQLLAGMEQEPVAEISQAQEYDLEGNLRHQRDIDYYQDDIDKLPVGAKLYAAPQLPQPAVAEKAITQHFDTIALDVAKMVMCDVNRRHEFLGGDVQLLSRIQCRIDDACRAAMLQDGNSPVTPDGWQLVPKEPTEAMNKAGWAAMNEHDAIN
ncbi:TPA: hypothetical protein ACJIK4_003373, partial [Kluyvera cryocrescens]